MDAAATVASAEATMIAGALVSLIPLCSCHFVHNSAQSVMYVLSDPSQAEAG